jgi:nitrous oxidase accessory protein
MYSMLLIKTAAASKTWTVDADGSADYTTIQQAIDDMKTLAGDTILVRSGIYCEHLVVDKSLSIIGEHRSSTIIHGGGYGSVVTVAASNVTLKEFTIQNGEEGVTLVSNGNNVTDNILTYNSAGVLLDTDSEENMILSNSISFSSTSGIYGDRCGQNTIANNAISSSSWHGIFLYASGPCVLNGNLILSNKEGLFIRYSSNNTVTENFVSDNDVGIHIQSDEDPLRPSGLAKHNLIRNNTARNNSLGILIRHLGETTEFARNEICENSIEYNNLGLNISGSTGNLIYNNNFINNSKQVAICESSNNTWDGGYYAGGNYWSDHNGADVLWGSYQNETGSDGIVDLPYEASSNPLEGDRYQFVLENEWLAVPDINVVSPSNGTYRLNSFPLVFTINKPVWASCSLDGQPNVTVVKNLMLHNLSIGVHNMTVYVNDTLGNEVSSKTVFTITFLGDLSLDGTVNIIDISIVAYSFGHSLGSEKWNPDADLNNDYIINIVDVATVATEFGNTINTEG